MSSHTVTADPDLVPTDAVDPTPDSAPNTPAEAVLPKAEAVYMDPALLEIGENVRKNFRLQDHPDDTESIREHGVLDPIKAIRMPDGRIVVRDGQVRTLAALAFEQPLVPVWLIDADTALSATESELDRIFEQIILNDRRIALTEGDRAAGIAQALDLGASVTRVSKALQIKRDKVKLAHRIGASATARGLVDDGQFDFEQAAIIADYENLGDTDAVQRLLNAPSYRFSYEAKRIANDRAEQRAHLAAGLPYAELGVGVLTEYPDIDAPDSPLIPATDLVDADGRPVTSEILRANPSVWLVWLELDEDPLYIHIDTGAVVDADIIDWETERDPDRAPREGMHHANKIQARDHWRQEYFLPVAALAAAGLALPASTHTVTDGAETVDDPGASETSAADELAARRRAADEAARAAAAEAEAAEREKSRQANRRVRELNKQGLAAGDARREFVARLLTRKSPPPQAAKFVAAALAAESGLLAEYNAFSTAMELLGSATQLPHALQDAVESATPARCQVIVLGLVLGSYEKRTGKDCWRYQDRGVRRYMSFLREVGHQLVPVELAAAGELDPDLIDIDTPAASETPAA